MAIQLRGYQNRYLRGLAHSLKPVILIGQKGISPATIESISGALADHELIKVKFIDLEDRARKKNLIGQIEESCDCSVAGVTGHVAILYRPQDNPAKRKITLPERG